MKALVLSDIGKLETADITKPQVCNDTDVLLKVSAVGICGSDIHYYKTGRIGRQVVKFPYILGHECSAVVEQVGKAVKNIRIGDLVVVEPAVSCHKCIQCRMGRENTCCNLKFLGTPGQLCGCICEYIVLPAENCLVVSDRLTAHQAVLCEPFTIGLYAVKRILSQLDCISSSAVLGCGPIGLSVLEAAKANGTKEIFATDKLDYRLQIANKQGAEYCSNPDKTDIVGEILKLKPQGVDVVYECAGQTDTLVQAIEVLRPGGILVLIGIPLVDKVNFKIEKLRRKELTILNIRRQNRTTLDSIELIASSKVNIDYMITHRFGFEQSAAAFDMVAGYKDNVVKAVIEF